MAGMDWVPAFGWGTATGVGVNTQQDFTLMDIADQYTVGDVVGQIEESEIRYFVHRIVGQFAAYYTSTPLLLNPTYFRIWPAPVNTEGAPVATSPDFLDEADGVNPRIWWTRQMRLGQAQNDMIDPTGVGIHPWWSTIDIQPKQVIEKYTTPVFSLFNADTQAVVNLRYWLRLLVTPLK